MRYLYAGALVVLGALALAAFVGPWAVLILAGYVLGGVFIAAYLYALWSIFKWLVRRAVK